MAQNEEVLRRTQAKIEVTRGDAEVATTKRLYDKIRLNDAREPLDFAEQAGTRSGRHTHVQGPVDVSGTVEGKMTYDDTPWWLEHGIEQGVTAASDGHLSLPAYTRLYIPTMEGEDLASSTMEHGAPDNVYRSTMVMVPSFTIRGDIDSEAAWAFTAPLFARDKEPLATGFTAGVPLRDRNFIRGAGTKLFIDDLADDIGTTQLLQKFISFSLTWDNALSPKRYMEDEAGISKRVGVGELRVTGQVRLEFDNDDEAEHYRNGDRRTIRIERSGDIIHGVQASPSLPETRERIRIDIPRAHWLTPSDDPRGTNMTLTFGFEAYIDATFGYPASIEVVSRKATL